MTIPDRPAPQGRRRYGVGLAMAAVLLAALGACSRPAAQLQANLPWSQRIAESFLARDASAAPADRAGQRWTYEEGFMLHALLEMSEHTGDGRYATFVRQVLDGYIGNEGVIRTYPPEDYNLDNIAPGRAVMVVFAATRGEKYRRAADSLLRQLRDQPRTAEGGYWHKKIYPFQMWLDGLYMAQPFRARCAQEFGRPELADDIADQFTWISQHTRDPKTGLFYHGWDESRAQRWADSVTGCSPNFWGRSMGWFAMALVDVLDAFPPEHPRRAGLLAIFDQLAPALVAYQDSATGLWYQVVDQGGRPGNYLETSASCMFAYAFAKGVARGYLPASYLASAQAAFNGVARLKVEVGADGVIDLLGTCRSAGLGGSPYRDGSYAYYIGEPQRTNDLKGVAAFLLAAIELEKAGVLPHGAGQPDH